MQSLQSLLIHALALFTSVLLASGLDNKGHPLQVVSGQALSCG